MPPEPVIRPLLPEDVAAADAAGWAALRSAIPPEFIPPDDLRATRGRARVAHLQSTDPGGAWVADRGGEILGVALALVREGVWGLSLLGVVPEAQGEGIGGRLLKASLRHAEDARGGIILSSTDARAMRRYHRAGFAAKPALSAAGEANRSRIPAGLRSRPGDPVADRSTLDVASRFARGASHVPDVEALLGAGSELLVLEDRGFVVQREGSAVLLAALDDDAARDLLWSSLAAAPPGGPLHLDFITERNDWAIEVALDAGLSLTPEGPVFVRGQTGSFAPYLPSGAYL